jgi:SAM-dependent methyltransferase
MHHQTRDEMNITGQPVQPGDADRRTLPARFFKRGGKLRSPVNGIGPFAGLDLDVYATQCKVFGSGEPLRGLLEWRSAMSVQTQHDPKNEAEITYWNSAGGRRWVERQQSQDIVLGPILQAALERAQLRQGERVVDIGCGTGASSIALAERAGPSGQVLGVDVSAPMLARAAERLPPGAPVKFVRADATTYRFEPAAFDLLFSRFGVMFFAEPARAFANLRAALKPSGRLAFACWRKFAENPWLQVPLRAALEHVPPLPRPGLEDPGPFSFAGEQRVNRILANAGFQSVILEPRDFDLDIACGGGIEEAVEAAMALGPTSRALQDQSPKTRAAVATSIRRALQPYQRNEQVALAGGIWLVTANNA